MRRHVLRVIALIGLAGQLQQLPATMACAMRHRETPGCAEEHHGPGPVVRASGDQPAASCATMSCGGNLGQVFVGSGSVADPRAFHMTTLVPAPLKALVDVGPLPTAPPPKA